MVFLIQLKRVLGLVALWGVTAWAQAPAVQIEGAWVRATVPGQRGTGAFMSLRSEQGLRLVGVSSPVAGVAEVHEMKVEGDVMRMRSVPYLDLPAGKSVALQPGGYHLMLMDLKQPLLKDTRIPLTLRLQNAQGQTSQVQLSVPVALQSPLALPAGAAHIPSHKH